jgi:acetyl-CoA carboxylase biotin carboxyl carrier protein
VAQDVDSELVHKLAKLLEETGLGEIEYATDTWRIRVARPAPAIAALAAPAFTAAAPAVAEAGPAVDHVDALKSPMVGTAYLAPDPQSSPFVSVGSSVVEGDTVMIIEAMKVMNTIAAHRSGIIKEIMVTSGQPTEFGQVLMVIG